jgi:hypothetical protein
VDCFPEASSRPAGRLTGVGCAGKKNQIGTHVRAMMPQAHVRKWNRAPLRARTAPRHVPISRTLQGDLVVSIDGIVFALVLMVLVIGRIRRSRLYRAISR